LPSSISNQQRINHSTNTISTIPNSLPNLRSTASKPHVSRGTRFSGPLAAAVIISGRRLLFAVTIDSNARASRRPGNGVQGIVARIVVLGAAIGGEGVSWVCGVKG